MVVETHSERQTYSLTPEQLKHFHERGYIAPIRVYEPDDIRERWRRERIRLLDRTHAVYQHAGAEIDPTIKQGVTIANYDRHLDNPFLSEHVCKPEIVDRVVSILGPNVVCWRSEFFPKYPGDEGTDWHQADTFANASGKPQLIWSDDKKFGGTITVWTAFTDSTIEKGCLQFIPSTHSTMFYDENKKMHYDPSRINAIEKEGIRRGFFGYDYRDLQKDPRWSPDESKAVSIELKAGESVFFWSTLMHASHPHAGKTNEMRLGFVSRYVPTSVRVYPDTQAIEEFGDSVSLSRYGTVLVAGRDDYGHNRRVTHTTRGTPFALPRQLR